MSEAKDIRSGSSDSLGRNSSSSDDRFVVTDLRLWFGVMGGAIAWLFHLLLSYGIAEFGCVSSFRETRLLGITGVAWLEIGISLLTLAVAIGATVVAQANKKKIAGEVDAARLESSDPRVFMGRSGVLASGIFVFIIVVQAVPVFFYLRDC